MMLESKEEKKGDVIIELVANDPVIAILTPGNEIADAPNADEVAAIARLNRLRQWYQERNRTAEALINIIMVITGAGILFLSLASNCELNTSVKLWPGLQLTILVIISGITVISLAYYTPRFQKIHFGVRCVQACYLLLIGPEIYLYATIGAHISCGMFHCGQVFGILHWLTIIFVVALEIYYIDP